MRKIMYTFVEVQCSVLVGRWQVVAANGRLVAIPAKAGTGGCVVEYFQEVVRMAERLGDYQLVRILGCGGFAEVYLGEYCVSVPMLPSKFSIRDLSALAA
jgi:hypothetical protein